MDLLVASELVEFVLACVMPVYSYMVIWSINGWGYDAPRVLVKALCVVVLAQQALRGYAQVIAYTAPDIQTCTIRLSCAILVFQVRPRRAQRLRTPNPLVVKRDSASAADRIAGGVVIESRHWRCSAYVGWPISMLSTNLLYG